MKPDRDKRQLLAHEKERLLLSKLREFEQIIPLIADNYEVHRLPRYATELADILHSFYDVCRVIDPEHAELSKARLALVDATRTVLAQVLYLLGVEAPERM